MLSLVCGIVKIGYGKRGTAWWIEDLRKPVEREKRVCDIWRTRGVEYEVLNKKVRVGAYK